MAPEKRKRPQLYKKYTLECTQLHNFKKISRKSIPSNPPAMKLNTARQSKRNVLQFFPIISKLSPMFIHGFLPLIIPPNTPPPDNDRICGHNAMLAFPQEKISHYTTEHIQNNEIKKRVQLRHTDNLLIVES